MNDNDIVPVCKESVSWCCEECMWIEDTMEEVSDDDEE